MYRQSSLSVDKASIRLSNIVGNKILTVKKNILIYFCLIEQLIKAIENKVHFISQWTLNK